MAILDQGRVAQCGTPREIYRHPASRAVADFIGETNFLEGEVIEKANGRVGVRIYECAFTGRLSQPDWDPAVGEKVIVSIRPEAWALGDQSTDQNAFSGKIGESIYLGEVAQYAFTPSHGVPLKIFELNPRHLGSAGREETLFAKVDPDDVVILPRT